MDDNKFDFENNGNEKKEENINDFQNDKNIKEGKKEDRNIPQKEAEANDKKEKNTDEKEKADKEKVQGNVNDNKRSFSANYEPPYYVPNFTFYGTEPPQENEKKQKKKTVGIGVVAAICIICVLLSATVGAIAGAIAGGGIQVNSADGETVTITRSDRKINVEEILASTGHTDLSVAQVAALVGESVVEITTTHVETNPFYGQYITSGAGSGVIFSQNENYADIVTNYHVIAGANEISVRIKHGDSYFDYNADYIDGDAAEDIAIIRISLQSDVKLTVAVFVSDSDDLIVGEQVVAIGNPLGRLGGTVTDGIISALDREITIGDNVMTLLQTNAAINPGNSGGGLFNMSGELIGIVNAKQSSSGIEGLGFAIPANIVRKDITDLLTYGRIQGRVTLGINVQYYASSSLMTNAGVYVNNGGSTELRRADRIVKIGENEINTLADYNAALKKLSVGDTVDVQVVSSGKTRNVKLTALEDMSQN